MTSTQNQYWLTRIVFLRALGGIYFIAFFSLSKQLLPLFGSSGILPVERYMRLLGLAYGDEFAIFAERPGFFVFDYSDAFMVAACAVGVVLSALVAVGLCNGLVLGLLWVLYMSFVHIGQEFYGFGWEMLLLETGFLAIFLAPPVRVSWLPEKSPPPGVVFFMLRWLLFRLMFGAGLIKLRGDPCWRDFTCMLFHYETQPIPNPFSWHLHHMPAVVHYLGVLWNHVIELVVPWMLFGPRVVRACAGVLLVTFQMLLIISGNLSWLNWLTIAICIACFDDRILGCMFTQRFRERTAAVRGVASRSRAQVLVAVALTLGVAYLSIDPVRNLMSKEQKMNTSFDKLHLVNTYGAFGHIGKIRHEIVLKGTTDPVITAATVWEEYQFKCKPGDVARRPPIVSPYHYRLDWHIWFAAMSTYQRHPWLLRLVYLLLHDDRAVSDLLASTPFAGTRPTFIKADLYRYRFSPVDNGRQTWWTREFVGAYLPPLSADNASMLRFLRAHGWKLDDEAQR